MEQRIKILEEKGLEREDMVASLQLEVDDLKTKICHCNFPRSRPSSREGTREVPFELEYASDSEYVAPSVVTALVLIDVEVVRDPSLALRFRDNEEEGLIVMETRESLPSVADPQENEVPILIRVSLPPPVYQESVRSGQCCIHSNGVLKKTSFCQGHSHPKLLELKTQGCRVHNSSTLSCSQWFPSQGLFPSGYLSTNSYRTHFNCLLSKGLRVVGGDELSSSHKDERASTFSSIQVLGKSGGE